MKKSDTVDGSSYELQISINKINDQYQKRNK